jgi:anti-sigma factor RsiW
MTHLTPQQFVDAVDGTLTSVPERHLQVCESCRAQLASLRSLEADVRGVATPEPSPLFWDHLSDRIRRATSTEPIPQPEWWRALWGPAMTAGLAVATVAIVFVVRGGPGSAPITESGQPAMVFNDRALVDDESFKFVAGLASQADVEDLHQAARPTPDGIDAALNQLNDEQRARLVRLLQTKMGSGE